MPESSPERLHEELDVDEPGTEGLVVSCTFIRQRNQNGRASSRNITVRSISKSLFEARTGDRLKTQKQSFRGGLDTISTLSLLFLVPNRDADHLLPSVLKELHKADISYHVESYLPQSTLFLGNPEIEMNLTVETSFDAVIAIDIGYLNGQKLKEIFPGVPLVMFAGDTPQALTSGGTVSLVKNLLRTLVSPGGNPYIRRFGLMRFASQYDLILASDPGAVREFTSAGLRANWFPYWSGHGPATAQSLKKSTRMKYDLVSVMSPRPERFEILHQLAASEKIKFRHFSNVPEKEIFDIYRDGLAVLNISSYGEMTIRFMEAFSAGKVVVTNRLRSDSGLDELFVRNKHYYVYETVDEIEDIMEDLKKNFSETLEFGLDARRLVEEQHLPKHRADYLVKIVRDIL